MIEQEYLKQHENQTTGKQQKYDICLYVSGKDSREIVSKLETDVRRVSVYLQEKGLCLNELKTEFMFVHRKSATGTFPPLQLSTSTIQSSQSVRYLGLLIDEHLTFATHIRSLSARVYARLKVFKRVRNSLDARARRTFYVSFIQSMLEYASNAYVHSLNTEQYSQLIRISKRAQRYVFGYPARAHTAPIRNRHNLIPIEVRFTFRLHVFVYRCLHKFSSSLLCALFVPRSSASHTTARTRSQTQSGLSLPPVHTRAGYFSLAYLAADRWNALPATVRSAPTLVVFRSSLLSFLGYPVRRPRPVGTTLS